MKTTVHQQKIERKENDLKIVTEISAKTEFLLTEESG